MTDDSEPRPVPPVFDLDAAETENLADYPPFAFVRNGQDHSLPNPMTLPIGVLQRIDQAMRATAVDEDAYGDMVDLLEAEFGEAGAALKTASFVGLSKLMAAWQGMVSEEGKSLSPPSAPNRAARRSKPTSRSGAKTSGRSRSAKPAAVPGSS